MKIISGLLGQTRDKSGALSHSFIPFLLMIKVVFY